MTRLLRITQNVPMLDARGLPTREFYAFLNSIIDNLEALQSLGNYTATQIASVTDEVNTKGKTIGRAILDVTNHRVMVARGTAPADPWDVADGSASVTPA